MYGIGGTKSLPHACGGVSSLGSAQDYRHPSSPRLWGCFQRQIAEAQRDEVFPTPVGVFLMLRPMQQPASGLPHACGGVSSFGSLVSISKPSSPRLWGCFQAGDGRRPEYCVFPTPVGVFPTTTWLIRSATSLPHACGGVSKVWICLCDIKWSSPRLWGCFPRWWYRLRLVLVFPTPVGVFPQETLSFRPTSCLPHACGGVSFRECKTVGIQKSSPRLWGCFCLMR